MNVDLLHLPGLGAFLRWRHARIALQVPLMIVALSMIGYGFWGSSLAPKNPATVLTWIHYRGLVVLVLLLVGNLFCMACPFMGVRQLARRFARPARFWPRPLRNKWLAGGLFALFLFAYEYFDLWSTPFWTAGLIFGYFLAALLVDSIFTGAPFCKYLCPIGQFNFVASLVSPFEVSVRDASVCATCKTKDCIRGRDGIPGCELWLFQPRKVGNMDCTFCLDCIHACPYDNVGIQARVPATELWNDAWRSGVGRFSQRWDIGTLVVLFTFGALLNAFAMVSPVYALESALARILQTRSELPVLGLLFAIGLVIEPAILLLGTAWISRRWGGLREDTWVVLSRFVYSLVPLGVGIWAAHYGFHFLTGLLTFVPVLQYTFRPWLGTPQWHLGPVLPSAALLPIEFGILGLGWVGSMLVAYRLAEQEADSAWGRILLPWAALLTLILGMAVWLMMQPMEMRATILQ